MAKNKYAADYRLIEEFDEKGRVHVSTEYIGAEYRYAGDEAQMKRRRRSVLCLLAAGWVIYLAALIPYSQLMHSVRIVLPYVLSAVPLGIFTEFFLSLGGQKEKLEHRFADRIANDWPALMAAGMACTGLSAVFALAGLIRLPERLPGDWIGAAAAVLLFLVFREIFGRRHGFAAEKQA